MADFFGIPGLGSMLVMALIAAVQWDALALDERDTAILGPLPVAPRDIGRAKLSALVQEFLAHEQIREKDKEKEREKEKAPTLG